MIVPLEKGTTTIVWYPIIHREVDEKEIWKDERGGITTDKGLGLYIHIPFCTSICPFCPFNKYLWSEEKEKAYVKALKKEMDLYSKFPLVRETEVTSVYFGGGTPTVLTTDRLTGLLNYVEEKFLLVQNAEITVEAHPLTINKNNLSRIMEKGANRISIGIQSFAKRLLRILKCYHEVEEGIKSIKTAKDVGFKNIGIDLLYRVPMQEMNEWKKDLETAVRYEIDHISCYNLGVFPGTSFYEGIEKGEIPKQPEQNVGVKMHRFARRYLEKCGYNKYTISNFAKDDKKCLFNRIALEAPQGEYVGLGAGAIEYINEFLLLKETSLERYISKVKSNSIPYMKGSYVSRKERMARYMVIGMGCLKVSKEEFRERFGVGIKDIYGEIIEKLKKWSLIEESASMISLTEKGMGYVASISKLFFIDVGKGIYQGERVI